MRTTTWIAILGGLLHGLTGCISIETSGRSTAEMMETISSSQFYKDAAVFYPDVEVENPTAIPELSESERNRLQSDLRRYLALVITQHDAFGDKLARVFRDGMLRNADAKLFLTDRNLAEALTSANGEIALDTRVIQSLLRSSLLTTFEVEILIHRVKINDQLNRNTYTLAEEKIAIDTYLDAREQLHLTPGRSHFGDLFAADSDEIEESGELDWFELSELTNKLSNVDVRYDVQLLFLIAHEYGHIVLGHFGEHPVVIEPDDETDACHRQRSLEATADAYAALLVTMGTKTDIAAQLMGGASVIDGLGTFFTYAYDYAGFSEDDSSHRCNNYPAPEVRLGFIARIYAAIRSGELDLSGDDD